MNTTIASNDTTRRSGRNMPRIMALLGLLTVGIVLAFALYVSAAGRGMNAPAKPSGASSNAPAPNVQDSWVTKLRLDHIVSGIEDSWVTKHHLDQATNACNTLPTTAEQAQCYGVR